MAAANAYRAKSATFSTAILGIESISSNKSGQATDHTSDASDAINAVFIDSIVGDITIVTSDFARASSIVPGDTGSLSVVYECRAEGRGATAGNNKTYTAATATVVSVNLDAPTTGKGQATITFRCSAPSGGTPFAVS